MEVYGIDWWVIGLAVALIVGIHQIVKRFRKDVVTGDDAYVEGVNALLAGELKAALEHLRRAVRLDSDNVDAYLRLGCLYREFDDPHRAFSIHSELTVRSNLRKQQRIAICQELAEDQWAMGDRAAALEYARSILKLQKRHPWARQFQLRYCEAEGEWDQAIRIVQEMREKGESAPDHRLACYRTRQGRAAYAAKDWKAALHAFDKAIAVDPEFLPPYILKGDTLLQKGNETDAVHVWHQALERAPHAATAVYDRLEKVLFDQGQFDTMESIYRQMLEREPYHEETLLRLAEFYFKKGQKERALQLAESLLAQQPSSVIGRIAVMQFSESGAGDPNLAKLWSTCRRESVWHCQVCDASVSDMTTDCPDARSWCPFIN